MRPETATALQRINRQFYRLRAAEFSATRERPWPAWERIAEICRRRREGRLSVLDLGCGNGRLGRFLEERWSEPTLYLGLDASEPMLGIARAAGGNGRFLRRDLVREGLPDELPGGPFDLVAAFGLMHHLPGLERRATLLRAAAHLLAPEGVLAVSFWQFGGLPRFQRRMLPWQAYNRCASEPVDTGDLEEGDVLLAWGDGPLAQGALPPVRYCHWTRPEEVDRLLAGLPLEPIASFRADGKGGDLNLYRVLRRS